MRKPYLYIIVFILCTLDSFGQASKKIEVAGQPLPNSDIFFVADVHYHHNSLAFIHSFSIYMHDHFGICNVAMETSESHAYLINRYIQYGDSAIFFCKWNPTIISALEDWRTINKALPHDKQITIFGADFERMDFIVALKNIFGRHEVARNSVLYNYINNLPDSFSNIIALGRTRKKLRVQVYGAAQDIFEKEKVVLKPLLEEDYGALARIMENPVTEKHFGKRDITIPAKLTSDLKGKRFICFLGGEHITMYRHFSALRKYLRNNDGAQDKITIITEVCKNYKRDAWANDPIKDTTDLMTIGPGFIRKSNELVTQAFTKYQKPGYYVLVDQKEFGPLLKKDNKGVPTYYVFTDLSRE